MGPEELERIAWPCLAQRAGHPRRCGATAPYSEHAAGHLLVSAAAPFSEHAACSMAAPYSEHATGSFGFQTGQQQVARAALQGITTPPLGQCDDVGEGETRKLKARAEGDARPITRCREDGFSCHPSMDDLANPSRGGNPANTRRRDDWLSPRTACPEAVWLSPEPLADQLGEAPLRRQGRPRASPDGPAC